MELLSRDEFTDLMETREGPCVSIYIPTHRAGKDIEQDPIRLKNSLREANEKLVGMGVRSSDAEDVLAPAQALLPDGHFWRHQSDGLALFLAPGFFRQHRLPLRFESLVSASERFHVKPLLPLLSGDGHFFILAISQNEVRLLRGTRYNVEPVELENVPKSLNEALKYDVEHRQLQGQAFTGDVSGKGGMPAGRVVVFHGHGVAGDLSNHKKDIAQFLLQLDRGLREVLREERAPLVLAGVEYLLPIYEEVNSYPNLLHEGVRGNPELLRPEELHQKAWKLVEPEFRRNEETAAAMYRDLLNSGRTADSIRDIVPAAVVGRVDCLFVTLGVQLWGNYDSESNEVMMYLDKKPGSQDLLDLAAYHTLANSGTVYALEPDRMPEASPAAAILRY